MDAFLFHLLTTEIDREPIAELSAFWPRYQRAITTLRLGLRLPLTIDRAVAGGFAADRLGYAFAAGYREALRQLVPALGETPAALCATEATGAHPRNIATRLSREDDGWRLSGDKTWVTLGTEAAVLLVVASEGATEQGRNRLCLCQIPATREGVTLLPQPPIPFAPEIPHAALRLRAVPIAPHERLAGDGYALYLKPFRTIEDLHVHAALLGWLLQISRRASWPRALQEELLALITTVRALASGAPDDPTLHLALGGLLTSCRRLLRELDSPESHWQGLEPTERARWQRDRPLLEVAGKARAQRLEAAWERLLLPRPATPASL